MKVETDDLYAKIAEFEKATKEANTISDKYDADIRDTGKKVQKFESNLENHGETAGLAIKDGRS